MGFVAGEERVDSAESPPDDLRIFIVAEPPVNSATFAPSGEPLFCNTRAAGCSRSPVA